MQYAHKTSMIKKPREKTIESRSTEIRITEIELETKTGKNTQKY